MFNLYVLSKDGQVIPCESVLKWADFFQTKDRIISKTKLKDGDKEILISTVFLGTGSRQALFETMVFGGSLTDYQERYPTKIEAEKGHKKIVARVKRSLKLIGQKPLNEITKENPVTRKIQWEGNNLLIFSS